MLPNVNCAYYLPTYGLIKDIAFQISEQLIAYNIPFDNRSDKEIHTPYGSILLRNMALDSIIGYEVGFDDEIYKDKMAEVFMKIIGRNRSILP
jgi:hypothetical protein